MSWRVDLVTSGTTVVAALAALDAALALRAATDCSAQDVVLAVVLVVWLGRAGIPSGRRETVLALVELPLMSVVAVAVGWLVFRAPWAGQPMLALALSVPIFVRRYGPNAQQVARLLTFPFLALLVTPVAAAPDPGLDALLLTPCVAALAVACAAAAATVCDRAGVTGAPTSRPAASVRRRWDAPTRMSLQMLAGVGSAVVAGHLLFGDRWVWAALSAYVVASGTAGRGDVIHRAGLRTLGAAAGTVAASLLGGAVPAGTRWTLGAVFVVMAAALALRRRSYAFWTAGMTGMVALLHSYYGQSGAGVLLERLGGVLVGSALGVAAAWFVFPVRTSDVMRRRLFDCLAALDADLAHPDAPTGLPAELTRLDRLAPTLRARERFTGDRSRTAAVRALHELGRAPRLEDGGSRLRVDVNRVRRAGRDHAELDTYALPEPLATVHTALAGTVRA